MNDHYIDLEWVMDNIDQDDLPYGVRVDIPKIMLHLVSQRLGIYTYECPMRLLTSVRGLSPKVRNRIYWQLSELASNQVEDIPGLDKDMYYQVDLVQLVRTYLIVKHRYRRDSVKGFERYLKREEQEGRYLDSSIMKLIEEFKGISDE